MHLAGTLEKAGKIYLGTIMIQFSNEGANLRLVAQGRPLIGHEVAHRVYGAWLLRLKNGTNIHDHYTILVSMCSISCSESRGGYINHLSISSPWEHGRWLLEGDLLGYVDLLKKGTSVDETRTN